MSKKSNTGKYISAGILATVSLGGFLGAGMNMFYGNLQEEQVDKSVESYVSSVAEHVQQRLITSTDAEHDMPISELVPQVKTSLPDSSLYFSGNYKDGYCITGFNEKGVRSDNGITFRGGSTLTANASCTSDASKMVLMEGPGDNKIADGADYEEPQVDDNGIFILSSLVSLGGIFGAAALMPYKPKPETGPSAETVAAGSPPIKAVAKVKDAVQEISHAKYAPTALENALARYEAIKAEWRSYELDLVKVLEYPSITDLSIPATGDFHKTLYMTNLLLPKDNRMSISAEQEEKFEKTVIDLEYKFRLMIGEAKRLNWSAYSAKERSSLRTAQNLLSIAMNSASSENERQIAYKRLIKELEGIVVLPEKATLELEVRIAPSISPSIDLTAV